MKVLDEWLIIIQKSKPATQLGSKPELNPATSGQTSSSDEEEGYDDPLLYHHLSSFKLSSRHD